MRAMRLVVAAASLLCYTVSNAQQGLVGSYDGQFMFHSVDAGGLIPIPAGLKITQVADGKVTGKFQIFKYRCRGDYSAEGTFEGDKLTLRTAKGSVVDCGGATIVLVPQGNKLVGKMGTSEIELTRE